jgi:hypothetical protein
MPVRLAGHVRRRPIGPVDHDDLAAPVPVAWWRPLTVSSSLTCARMADLLGISRTGKPGTTHAGAGGRQAFPLVLEQGQFGRPLGGPAGRDAGHGPGGREGPPGEAEVVALSRRLVPDVRARGGDGRGNRVDEAVAHRHYTLDVTDPGENLVADRDRLRPFLPEWLLRRPGRRLGACSCLPTAGRVVLAVRAHSKVRPRCEYPRCWSPHDAFGDSRRPMTAIAGCPCGRWLTSCRFGTLAPVTLERPAVC